MTILDQIIDFKKQEVNQLKKNTPLDLLEKGEYYSRTCFSAKESLKAKSSSQIIAEFKKKSPSKGWINKNAEPKSVCLGYEMNGAACISILTDNKFFGGSTFDISSVRDLIQIPILRKDFIVDSYQIHQAKAIGADFILLIAEVLTKKEISDLTKIAHEIGLEVLLEMHEKSQIKKIDKNIDLIGINNRNLKTFEVDLDKSIELLSQLPNNHLKIAESGLDDPKTLIRLKQAGFEGFLIGENFMKTSKPEQTLKAFIHQTNHKDNGKKNVR